MVSSMELHTESGERQTAGDNERAVTGHGGVSVAGLLGVAISGDGGYSQVGEMGYALSGEHGVAVSGAHGFSIAGVDGVAQSGPGGIITISALTDAGHLYSVSADIDDVNGPSADTPYRLAGHRFVLTNPIAEPEKAGGDG